MTDAQKIPLGKVSDLPPGRSKSYRAMGKDLIVVNVGAPGSEPGAGSLLGYVNFCMHMGGKLRCIGRKFECDWHGGQYDCHTGEAVPDTAAPEGANLEKLELLVEGDELYWLYTPKKSPWALE